MNNIYDPFKATVESILEMCEKYGSFESISEDERVRANDFLNNIRVKCKDAIEYDKLFLANMDKDLKNAVDSYYHMHADKNLDYMFLAKTASHFIISFGLPHRHCASSFCWLSRHCSSFR